MKVDVNQTEFPSDIHREIWKKRIALTKPELCKEYLDNETWEMFKDLYVFLADTYESMYDNPDKYFIDDENDYAWPGIVPRLGTLIYSHNQKRFLGGLVFNDGVYLYDTEAWPKKNRINRSNNFVRKLNILGIDTELRDGFILLSSKKYPRMLDAIYYWQNFWKKNMTSSNRYRLQEGYNNADYRILNLSFKRPKSTFDDLLRTLPDKNRPKFQELHDYVSRKGVKKDSGKFSYKYKDEHIIFFDYLPAICISYKLKAGNSLESFIAELNKQPDKDKLSTYLQTNATLCNHCGLSTCKAHVEYFLCYPHGSERHWHFENVDKTVFKAGGLEIRRGCRYHQEKVNNAFTDDEIAVLKRLIDIRFAQIDNL